jgi:lipid-A-disaccharide synthase-like uncharacterized protein
MDWNDSSGWLLFGLLGNLVFSSRFLVQWIASERARASVVPPVFWHLSLVGSLVLLAYALHRRDPVFVLAYLPNGFVYVRNLMLIRRGSAGVPAPERPGRPEVGARALASRES